MTWGTRVSFLSFAFLPGALSPSFSSSSSLKALQAQGTGLTPCCCLWAEPGMQVSLLLFLGLLLLSPSSRCETQTALVTWEWLSCFGDAARGGLWWVWGVGHAND